MKRPAPTALLALLLASALVYGVAQLFTLRLERGDVYPPYSTLRSDPLGAKAIYEALDELPGCDVRRSFRPLIRLHPASPVTLIYAGIKRQSEWGEEEFRELQSLVASGTRVVFAFTPDEALEKRDEPPAAIEKKDTPPVEADDGKTPPIAAGKDDGKRKGDAEKTPEEKKQEDEAKRHALAFSTVAGKLGFTFQRLVEKDGIVRPKPARLADPSLPLEPEISWHSAAYFDDFKPGWRTLYTSDGHAVVAERTFGTGSIVLASDSYFLSNEALRRERCPRLLAWLAAPARDVVFDEEHHGVTEDANIATLARKYRLHGLVASALFAVALFIWQSSAPFLPPPAMRRPDTGIVPGRSAEEGFISLLRRAIKPSELLTVCAAEWRKTFDPDGRTAKTAHIEKVIRDQRDSVTAYQTISQALSEKK